MMMVMMVVLGQDKDTKKCIETHCIERVHHEWILSLKGDGRGGMSSLFLLVHRRQREEEPS